MPQPSRPSLPSRLLRLAGQGIGIALITFALGELGARLVLDIRPLTSEKLVWQHHPRWGWSHRPNSEDTFVKLGTRQNIRINSKGLREREIPYERTPDRKRILVIGDSATVGFEVPQEKVFTRVAEEFLRERGHDVEILNAGHRAYGTDQALLFLQDEGLKYDPDLVIYMWTGNDLADNATIHRPFREYGKPYFVLDDEGELELRGVPVPLYDYARNLRVGEDGEVMELPLTKGTRFSMWLRDEVVCRSSFAVVLVHLAAAVPQLWAPLRDAGSYGDFRDGKPRYGRDTRIYQLTKAMVREMQRLSEAAGAEFRMIRVGDRWTSAIRDELELQDLGVTTRYKATLPQGEPFQIPFDPHWNELGHRIYGEALAQALIEHGL